MPDLSSTPEFGDRFTALRQLSSGTLAEIWLAHDNEFDLDLVIKRANAPADSPAADLLRREFAATRRLIHPHIVRVHELHEVGDQVFYTAEWVGGGDLGRLRGGSLPQIVSKAASIAEALEFAHDKGVIHRDLKCSNVLLDEQERPRVTDFGIAGLLQPGPEEIELVGGGSRVNESPQQRAGEAPCVADDIYGFGTLLFELITGTPFAGAAPGGAADGGQPSRPSTWRATPEELDDLVSEMVATEAADRPPDMASIRTRLDAIGVGLKEAKSPPSKPQSRPIRVHPPPRALDPRRQDSSPEPRRRSSRSANAWNPARVATAGLFFFLALVAVGVFVYLPDWVRQKQVAAAASPQGVDDEVSSPSTGDDEPQVSPETERSPPASAGTDAKPPAPQSRPASGAADPPRQGTAAPPRVESPPSKPPVKPPSVRAGESEKERAQEGFAQAMSSGLKSLADGSFAAAESSFQTALDLSPGSKEALDGLGRARQRLRLQAIELHGNRAREYAASERWQEAAAEYRAVLEIDATIRFAIEGEQEAARRAELNDRLNHFISNPDRLSSLSVLSAAVETLDQARAAEPTGPRIDSQIESLQQLVDMASTPIRVRLVSDNITEVVIYRVGELGKFEQRQLDLRPGSYTAVGRRDGYRDVRRVFKVSHGEALDPVVVRCEEKI